MEAHMVLGLAQVQELCSKLGSRKMNRKRSSKEGTGLENLKPYL